VKPSLSIVVPALDEASVIAVTLSALAPLRERGVEVIVVDGGSCDGTGEIARPYADLVITTPRGRAMQMNAGARRARGEVLLFLHADTRLPGNADRLVSEGLARSHQSWGRFDVSIEGDSPLLEAIACLMNWRSRLSGIATGDQAMFVRRDAFWQVGGFPEIVLMEDIAVSKRLKTVSPPLCLPARAVTSGRRWEERGVLRTILLMWRLRLAYFLGADPAALARRYNNARPAPPADRGRHPRQGAIARPNENAS
jgi:rSAM/selenodomain-associated transferase 2